MKPIARFRLTEKVIKEAVDEVLDETCLHAIREVHSQPLVEDEECQISGREGEEEEGVRVSIVYANEVP